MKYEDRHLNSEIHFGSLNGVYSTYILPLTQLLASFFTAGEDVCMPAYK